VRSRPGGWRSCQKPVPLGQCSAQRLDVVVDGGYPLGAHGSRRTPCWHIAGTSRFRWIAAALAAFTGQTRSDLHGLQRIAPPYARFRGLGRDC
jgi:hypothetical protein